MIKDYASFLESSSKSQIVVSDISEEEKNPYKSYNHLPMTFWMVRGRGHTDPPPLTLMTNPSNFNMALTKKIAPSFTRSGYIIEEWGEMQDVISCDGSTGAFITITNGLDSYNSRKTIAFRELYSLLYIYRNNGHVYTFKTKYENESSSLIRNALQSPTKIIPLTAAINNQIDSVGNVFMSYDKTIYQGSFDTFAIEEDANKPFSLNFKFTFTVQYKVTLDYRKYYNYTQKGYETKDVTSNLPKNKPINKNNVEIISREGTINITPISTHSDIPTQVTLASAPDILAIANILSLTNQGYSIFSGDQENLKQIYFGILNNTNYEQEVFLENRLKDLNTVIISRTISDVSLAASQATAITEIMLSDTKKLKGTF